MHQDYIGYYMSNNPEFEIGDFVKYKNDYFIIIQYFYDNDGMRYDYGLKCINKNNMYYIFKPECIIKKLDKKEKEMIKILYEI